MYNWRQIYIISQVNQLNFNYTNIIQIFNRSANKTKQMINKSSAISIH